MRLFRSALSGCVSTAAFSILLTSGYFSACVPAGGRCATTDVSCAPESALLYLICERRQLGGALQGCGGLDLQGIVATFAGDGSQGAQNGIGTAASFRFPKGIATDGASLFVVDTNNNQIRTINLQTLAVSAFVGSGANGAVDGVGAAAEFALPDSVTTNGSQAFVGDVQNFRVRAIEVSTTNVSTFAGSSLGFNDAVGTAAQFRVLSGMTMDDQALYIADSTSHRIRKVDLATANVTTLAGDGVANFQDGVGTGARLNAPQDVTTDGTNLYVADTTNNRIRKIELSTLAVTTLAGDGTAGFADGAGTAAVFNGPRGITCDGLHLYVADTLNHRIRKVEIATGTVSTIAGDGTGAFADGQGAGARFNRPESLTTNGIQLYVLDTLNQRIRSIR
ncbi:MAG: hypothetical protein NXI24_08040 [bacterium]|nr:hypothetical protein [bacterium]